MAGRLAMQAGNIQLPPCSLVPACRQITACWRNSLPPCFGSCRGLTTQLLAGVRQGVPARPYPQLGAIPPVPRTLRGISRFR